MNRTGMAGEGAIESVAAAEAIQELLGTQTRIVDSPLFLSILLVQLSIALTR